MTKAKTKISRTDLEKEFKFKIYDSLLPENGFTEPIKMIRASDAKKLMQRIIELESGKTFPPGKDKEKKIVKRFVKYVSHIEWTPFDENGPFPNNGELVLVAWIGRHSPLFDSRKIAEAQFRYYPDDDMKMFVVANDKSFVADEEVCPTHWARPLTHLPLFGPERN